MILAVDPGLTGGLAWTDGRALSVRDMPTRQAPVNGRDRKVISEDGVFSLLRTARIHSEILLIEQVGGMPGQSGPAAFTFGYGVGVIIGAAVALGYRIERVAPARWKGAMGVPSNKDAARALAAERWPEHATLFKRKMDDGRAEASLIAAYGWQVFGRLDDDKN
jgi:crossover junction endodeoxyribonuclease RuvC